MSTEINLHSVQAEILRTLLFQPLAKFSELNLSGLLSDHFTFHIKKLVADGLVEKRNDRYSLSVKGKEFANRMDTDTIKFERQGKIDVLVIGVQEEKEPKYLVQQRKKQPFYGFHGYVTGKVRWGEQIIEAAIREFGEETGLTGSPILLGVEHKMDIKDGEVLEDKFFHVCSVNNPKGELIEDFEGGRNLWLSEKEIHDLPKLFPDVFDVLEMVKGKTFTFSEKKFEVIEY